MRPSARTPVRPATHHSSSHWSFLWPQAPSKEDKELWDRVAELGVHDPLPAELPASLYFSLQGVLRCGHFADLLQPYLECFPPDK